MAGINLSAFILNDCWPGHPNTNLGVPANGWDSTTSCFKTTAASDTPKYPLGTKITAYTDNTHCPGWYTMMYLQFHSYEAVATYEVSKDYSDGLFWCAHADGSTAQALQDTTTVPYYVVTRCITKTAGDVSNISAVAIPCWTASSDGTGNASGTPYTLGYGDSYGWFWVGGVCPCKDATILDGTAGEYVGACVSGNFVGKALGPVFLEYSAAISTAMLTCDPTSVCDTTTYFENASMTPLGYICMTAV